MNLAIILPVFTICLCSVLSLAGLGRDKILKIVGWAEAKRCWEAIAFR